MKCDELKWNWVYYPYLDAPNKQAESALKAGYIKVVIKDEVDAVIKELKTQKSQAEDDCAFWKKRYNDCKRELDLLRDTKAFTMEEDE